MASTLEQYVNRLVSIITTDGRNFVGTLKGFDQTINIILEDTHERVFSPSAGVEQVNELNYQRRFKTTTWYTLICKFVYRIGPPWVNGEL